MTISGFPIKNFESHAAFISKQNVVISKISNNYTNQDYLHATCKYCKKDHYSIISMNLGSNYFNPEYDYLVTEITNFCDQHRHEEEMTNYNVPKTLEIFVKKCSNNHVEISHYSDIYGLKCKYCKYYINVQKSDINGIEGFCINHKHENAPNWGELKSFVYQEPDKDYKVTLKNTIHTQTFKPGELVNVNSGETIDFLGSLTAIPAGPVFNNISISQDTLKFVAKESNFNVDLQAKVHKNNAVSEYGAVCTKCNERFIFHDAIQFFSSDRSLTTWVNIKEFCNKHRHDGRIEKEPVGRKFKQLEL